MTHAERQRRYREAHPEKTRESSRRYRSEHREEIREREWARRQLVPEHLDKQLERVRRFREAHREESRENARRYAAEHPEQRREAEQRRRARKRGGFVAPVDIDEVFKRCRGRCHICGGRVSRDRKHPDPLAATVDHLVPLARGGTHEPANVSLAHRRCNESRGAGRTPAQLWLIAS